MLLAGMGLLLINLIRPCPPLVQKSLRKAVIAGAAAVALVALALVLMQGAKPAPASVEENGAGDNSNIIINNTGTIGTTTAATVVKTAAPTTLECHNDSSAGRAVVVISAKLADQSSGMGIPGKQVIFTILPGNPVAISPTDGSGQVSVSMNASEFSKERSSVFIFFDGDKEYEFSSCRIDIVTP